MSALDDHFFGTERTVGIFLFIEVNYPMFIHLSSVLLIWLMMRWILLGV